MIRIRIFKMNKKDNSTIHVLLISLLVSLIVNYYVSFLYKQNLLTSVGEQVYYQFITWLSLAQPVLIGFLYFKARKCFYSIKKGRLLSKKINIEKLKPETKEKLEALQNGSIEIEREIEELYAEENR